MDPKQAREHVGDAVALTLAGGDLGSKDAQVTIDCGPESFMLTPTSDDTGRPAYRFQYTRYPLFNEDPEVISKREAVERVRHAAQESALALLANLEREA